VKFLLSPVLDNIVLITAILNIVAVLVVFSTCRFVPALHLTKPLTNKKWFKLLYKYHSYVWWLLMPSVAIHATLAILHRLAGG
jgi:hypothetical protein